MTYVWTNDANDPDFRIMFEEYFNGFGMACDDEMFDAMSGDMKVFPMEIVLMYDEQGPVGFSLVQTDTEDNPWCMCPGAADIREFFVRHPYRNRGFGKMMFREIESRFKARGHLEIRISSDDSGPFWVKLGFVSTGRIIEANNSCEYRYVIPR